MLVSSHRDRWKDRNVGFLWKPNILIYLCEINMKEKTTRGFRDIGSKT